MDSQYVSDNVVLMPYVHDDNLHDDITFFALKCEDFLFICALDAELEVCAHGRLSARERFGKACGFHLAARGG